jgi:hypothetical protein
VCWNWKENFNSTKSRDGSLKQLEKEVDRTQSVISLIVAIFWKMKSLCEGPKWLDVEDTAPLSSVEEKGKKC